MLIPSNFGFLVLRSDGFIWDDPLYKVQTPISVEDLDLLRSYQEDRLLGKLPDDSALGYRKYEKLVNLNVLVLVNSERFADESKVMDSWGQLPNLLRNYVAASRVTSGSARISKQAHDSALYEDAEYFGIPKHCWELSDEWSLETGPAVSLSEPFGNREQEILSQISRRRRSERFFNGPYVLSWGQLSTILRFAAGYHDIPGIGGEHVHFGTVFRNAPSAVGRGSTEVFVRIGPGIDIEPGYYLYNPRRDQLIFQAEIDTPEEWEVALSGQNWVTDAPVHLILAGDPQLISWKYKSLNALKGLLLDIGHVSQLVLLMAECLGVRTRPVGLFLEDRLEKILSIEPSRFVFGVIIALGKPHSKV